MARHTDARIRNSLLQPRQALDHYLRGMLRHGASDLHLLPDRPPLWRVHGELLAAADDPLSPEVCFQIIASAMTPDQESRFLLDRDLDFGCALVGPGGPDRESGAAAGAARFRVNVFEEVRGRGAVFRAIPADLPSLEALRLPRVVSRLADLRSGLVLVSGSTGSGKTTTLAALVDRINRTREAHILTIEDPIEFAHANHKSLVGQREVGTHTESFASALRMAAREDPDVLAVGELRDLETFRLTLRAAELGVLVFATVHASSAARAVDRVVDVFPADEQPQVRSELADSLRAVVAQRLLPSATGKGRVLACEVLLGTSAIATLIREAKGALIQSALQTGTGIGMQTMDGAILDLWQHQQITQDIAREAMSDPELLLRAGLAQPPIVRPASGVRRK